MKIEIEYGEVERLRNRIAFLEEEKTEMENQLKEIDENKLKSRAVDLAKRLFNDYMTFVFKELGFDQVETWDNNSVQFNDNLVHWIGPNWWETDRVSVVLGANISTEWRNAFLRLGIIPEKKESRVGIESYEL